MSKRQGSLDSWQQALNLVPAFFLGFKAGYLQEPSAGEGFEHLRIIAGLHVFKKRKEVLLNCAALREAEKILI